LTIYARVRGWRREKKRNINTARDMYSTRRSGPVTDLHNAHTVSSLMRTMTTSQYPHRNSSRSKLNLNGTLPFRSSSIHQVWNKQRILFNSIKTLFLKVDTRDHRVHDSDRLTDVFKLEAKLKNNEKIITHQNTQVKK
jgi:hypothetical protein